MQLRMETFMTDLTSSATAFSEKSFFAPESGFILLKSGRYRLSRERKTVLKHVCAAPQAGSEDWHHDKKELEGYGRRAA
jgi:hypothetical protein